MKAFLLILFLALAPTISHADQPRLFAELYLAHNIQAWTDWMIVDDREWMGNNPRIGGAFGLEWRSGWRLEITTDTSLFTGAPFKEKTFWQHQQELHWAKIQFGYKWGGY